MILILSASCLTSEYLLHRYITIDSVAVRQVRNLATDSSSPADLGKVRQAIRVNRRAMAISCEFNLHKPASLNSDEPRYLNLF